MKRPTNTLEKFDGPNDIAITSLGPQAGHVRTPGSWHHLLPPLPYGNAALEPVIDVATMTLHHDTHHEGYVSNLNALLEQHPQYHDKSAEWLLLNFDELPQDIRDGVRQNAGGHVNHSQFWRSMSAGGSDNPAGPLAAAIDRDFGGLEQFKIRFSEVGAHVFGSGWVWLARTRESGGRLKIYATSGHDNPIQQGHYPLLVNDVWEHAYYLRYNNRRADYLQAWWSVVDWAAAARRFEQSDHSAEQGWEDEGGSVLASQA
jgi:Fe-Mn family superoxide dismutase